MWVLNFNTDITITGFPAVTVWFNDHATVSVYSN